MSAETAATAELLLELDRLDPGERVDGWLVFELSGGERPDRVQLCGPAGSGPIWQVDITYPIENRHVYAGRVGTHLSTSTPRPQ